MIKQIVVPIGFAIIFICVIAFEAVFGQLERERVQTDEPVYNVFWASVNPGIGTVRNLQKGNLNSTVLHTFGLVEGGIDNFFGLDDGANTRLGIDYGITDRLSLGIGRMTFNKIVDIRGKYNILRQTTSGSMPLELAVKLSTGINTTSGIGLDFPDRLTYFSSLMVARKFNSVSLQLTPMMARYNQVPDDHQDTLYGIGILGMYEINERFSVSGEYLPVLGDRNPSTKNSASVTFNIDTGGHVFQLFLTTSQWHGESFMMANNRNRFTDGEFRFGFNINRVFGL